jgi:hypothetical protein
MTSRISYNIHATSKDFDKGKLLAHLTRIRPAWALVMDGLQVCRDIKAALPECNVIHRAWPDEEVYKTTSPQDWVAAKKKEVGDADVWCYTVNEMGFGDQLLNWFTAVIEFASKANLKVVIGNFSVGTPHPEEWQKPAAVALLQALDKHRDIAVMAFHEYGIAVATSGLIGGNPDHAGVEPGKPGGQNLIPPENWPTPEETRMLTHFHMGRFNFMLAFCRTAGIKPPRMIISEWGFDDVSDLKPWADTLPKTAPYTTIRGWKSCVEAWKRFFSAKGWNAEQAMFYQLAWADKAIYQGTPVEAQLVFSWGHSSDDWDQFDTSQSVEFHALIETYAQAIPTPAPVIVPVPVPPVVTPPPPTPETLPSKELLDWRRFLQLDHEVKLVIKQIADLEDDVENMQDEMRSILERYNPISKAS